MIKPVLGFSDDAYDFDGLPVLIIPLRAGSSSPENNQSSQLLWIFE